jgi:hypothetical protein
VHPLQSSKVATANGVEGLHVPCSKAGYTLASFSASSRCISKAGIDGYKVDAGGDDAGARKDNCEEMIVGEVVCKRTVLAAQFKRQRTPRRGVVENAGCNEGIWIGYMGRDQKIEGILERSARHHFWRVSSLLLTLTSSIDPVHSV